MRNPERLVRIDRLVRQRRLISFDELQRELEVSRATLHRDLRFLRDRLAFPIVFDRDRNGYYLDESQATVRTELPGVWLSEQELYALLLARQLLRGIEADATLGNLLAPMIEKLDGTLGGSDRRMSQALLRVQIIDQGRRPTNEGHFNRVLHAIIDARRLALTYFTRARKATSQRDISPQRLMHYRGAWYVDAWCHYTDALRRFALDAFKDVKEAEGEAKSLSLQEVQRALDSGYGIFSGSKPRWAKLLVSANAAMWISNEQWHPNQKTRWLPDGRYELRVPFTHLQELTMDILRHAGDVEVVEPQELRQRVKDTLTAAAHTYGFSQKP